MDKKEHSKEPSIEESKEMQEKVILYQLLQKHLETLGQNAVLLERRYEETEATRQALEDISRLSEKNDILVHLGSGLFTYGKISDSRKMLVDVGAGVFMDKDPASSMRLLEEKKRELERLAEDMQHEMNEVSSRLNSLIAEIEKISHSRGAENHPSRKKEN